jgi:outer membrane protein
MLTRPFVVMTAVGLFGALLPFQAAAQTDDYSTPTEEEISGGQPRDYGPSDDTSPSRKAPEEEENAAERPPEDEAPLVPEDSALSRDDDIARKQRKIRLGLRGGYGLPLGNTAADTPLKNNESDPVPTGVSGLIPIWLDVGYMAFPKIMLGVYGRYGVGFFTECPRCSGQSVRFGIQIQYHFAPLRKLDPWLGFGFGYEFFSAKEKAGKVEKAASYSAHGFEFGNFQAGLDISVADVLSIGPFVSFSLNQFSKQTVGLPGASEISEDISDSALHMWLEPGLKVTFSF